MNLKPPISANWSFPTSVRFGAGRVSELPRICQNLGFTRPLLITDPGLAKLPLVKNVVESLEEEGIQTGLFHEIQPNPVEQNVADGISMFQSGKHDSIVAIGGGSALDAGKAIALMVGQTLPIREFDDVGDNWRKANSFAIQPVIAIPTTSGTGSEVGRAAVITDEGESRKIIAFHPELMPKLAILDPELAVGLPPHLTAATGFDALAHCFEAYCAVGYHPVADGVALEGLRIIRRWLPCAVEDGSDLEARSQMMAAAAMGAIAFQKGLGAIHSLSHPVGVTYGTHHGLTNGVFFPYVMAFNRSAIDERAAIVARHIGISSPSFEALLDWIVELREELGVPHTISELGVAPGALDDLAERASMDPTVSGNPRPLDVRDFRSILESACEGAI